MVEGIPGAGEALLATAPYILLGVVQDSIEIISKHKNCSIFARYFWNRNELKEGKKRLDQKMQESDIAVLTTAVTAGVSNLNERLGKLEGRVAKLEDDVSKVKDDVTTVKDRVTNVEDDVAKMKKLAEDPEKPKREKVLATLREGHAALVPKEIRRQLQVPVLTDV